MRIETNVRVIERNRKIAQYTFFVSMAIWLGSLGVTFLPAFTDRAAELGIIELIATLVLPFALGLALFAVYMTNLWIREPRPEQAIRDGLKGMNKKSILYHYHHSPAKHVLIAPQGIFVFVIRWQRGDIRINGERWRFQRSFIARIFSAFRLEGLGNPIAEAERAVTYLKTTLDAIAPDAEIHPIIIITDPRTEFVMDEDSPVTVLYAHEKSPSGEKQKPNLTEFMKKAKSGSSDLPLTLEQITAFEEATLPRFE